MSVSKILYIVSYNSGLNLLNDLKSRHNLSFPSPFSSPSGCEFSLINPHREQRNNRRRVIVWQSGSKNRHDNAPCDSDRDEKQRALGCAGAMLHLTKLLLWAKILDFGEPIKCKSPVFDIARNTFLKSQNYMEPMSEEKFKLTF